MDDMHTSDPYDLARFIDAQANIYVQVQQELMAGRKRTHWMWFVFPQLAGLGSSAMAGKFAIKSLPEARAFVEHPLLGKRLRDSTRLVIEVDGLSIDEILGFPDNLKFRSSMTLFGEAATDNALFLDALRKYFASQPDSKTMELLSASS
jgi:uncharacterized protein (DUF1810 family)